MHFKNKTILITGGATGIGFGFAQALAEKGNAVIISGRRIEKLREAQKAVPNLRYYACDVSDPDSLDELFGKFKNDGIVLDVVINNAGVLELWDINTESISSKAIFTKINTNLTGPIVITQNFLRQADHNKENYIINISTEASIMPVPIMPLYSSSKTGLSVFTEAIRIQLKSSKFRVIEVVPPAVETKMTTEDMTNTQKLADPKVFAQDALRAIEAGKLYYAPSTNAKLLRLIRRAFPKWGLGLIDKLSRQQVKKK